MARSRTTAGSTSPAFLFVMTTGIVNLFGDITYEGGASINGPFMASLGASAAIVSVAAGFGEFLGYALRLPSGYLADRTGRYWLITFVGYVINLFAVPAMALAGSWQLAAALVVAERIGRALRKPTVEAMLSYTTGELGKGWVYALNTALDEIGATIGPLLIALVLLLKGDFRTGYAFLLISAVAALVTLVVARVNFPLPSRLEHGRTASAGSFAAPYWLYMFEGRLGAVDPGAARHLDGLRRARDIGIRQTIRPLWSSRGRRRNLPVRAVLAIRLPRRLLPGPVRNAALGHWLCDAGHASKGNRGRGAARRETQSCIWAILCGLRSRLADGQYRNGAAVRKLARGDDCVLDRGPTCFATGLRPGAASAGSIALTAPLGGMPVLRAPP
jgi:Major Facilitator Superfamily